MVAAAKLRKSQDRIIQMRPFAKKMTAILQNISTDQSDEDNWFSQQRQVEKVLIITISSDRGLCGSFNSNTIKGTMRLIQEKYEKQHAKGNVSILPIGKKGFDFFTKRGYKVVGDFANLLHGLTYVTSSQVAEYLMEAFRNSTYDKIEVVYNQFKNVATQVLIMEQYLPVLPVEGGKKQGIDYIFQPNHAEILSGLIPKSLKVQLFKTLLDSGASENGARMTAMDKASENAGEILKDLKLTYNRTRQAAITKEILEIVAGAEALKAS